MPIHRFTASLDNTITNALKLGLTTRATGSNQGLADSLQVFSIYGQASGSDVGNRTLETIGFVGFPALIVCEWTLGITSFPSILKIVLWLLWMYSLVKSWVDIWGNTWGRDTSDTDPPIYAWLKFLTNSGVFIWIVGSIVIHILESLAAFILLW